MKLTVVIVNYNVRAYLEQCLHTVAKAMDGIDGEVYVVDNQSTDGSIEMVRERFPEVHLIANQENVGFSRANNQAIRLAKGEFVLLLNPDTVVGEDVFRSVLRFMDEKPACGGLGVKMIDGTGRFLPESKRGLPTPQVAFFKIIGLTRLFPKSRIFGRYHLGHLPENEAAPIEILSGACMFLRRKTLDEVGLLDENFFMYGEDIDLSYRITLGGYENWYFPDARIIHYKGESTKKSSVNYVFVFYNAMAIFAQKHFTQRSAGIFPTLINGSIYLSAAGAIAVRFLSRALLPILDFLCVLLVLTVIPLAPARWTVVPELGLDLLIGLFVVALTGLVGGYDRPVRLLRPLVAMGIVLALTCSIRNILDNGFQETLLIAMVAAIIAGLMLLARTVLNLMRISGHGMRRRERERILALGSETEAQAALALLWQTHYGLGWSGTLSPIQVAADPDLLSRTVRSERVGEVVYCAKDMPWRDIIAYMEQLRSNKVELKIAQPGVGVIIGPSSIESLQDLYILEGPALNTPSSRRSKRITDLVVSILLIPSFPIIAFFVDSPKVLAKHIGDVLLGRKSWVGYHPVLSKAPKLPSLSPGILDTTTPFVGSVQDPLLVQRLNTMYAKDYSVWNDLRVIIRGFRRLGTS
jgi:O-antigen biosynthesis protein